MKNLDLTKWLQMVWDALTEQDEGNRDRLLQSADIFRREDNTPQAGSCDWAESASYARTSNYLSRRV